MAIIANANIAIVWFAQAKYRQSILNPSAFSFENKSSAATSTKIASDTINLFLFFDWSICRASETISLKERSAVSPDVIGRTITPIIAIIPPILPRRLLATIPTTLVAGVSALASPRFITPIAAAAQVIAIKPSAIIIL